MSSLGNLSLRFFSATRGTRCLLAVSTLLLLLSATGAFAQVPASDIAQNPGAYQPDASAQPDKQSPTDATRPSPAGLHAAAADMEKERLAVNPVTGSATASGAGYEPLTGKERWKLYWKQNYFSVGAYFGPVFNALLLDQATGSPQQWGGGFPGYGRRVASRTADAILQGTFQAPVAALLHEDVRYISSPKPGGKRRVLHAIAYSFLTYNNEGHPTLNFANLGGYYAATAISTIWLPSQHSVAKYTLSNASEAIALTLPVNLLQEFWPEVLHTVFRRPEQH
jgi:hypothetical protein